MKKFLLSFKYAAEGILYCIKNERNFKVHCFATIAVVIMSFLLHISNTEWLVVLLNIGLVLSFEMLNTVVERLCNLLHPQQNPFIKIIKDVAAGAVLIVAVIALICAGIIFIPKIF